MLSFIVGIIIGVIANLRGQSSLSKFADSLYVTGLTIIILIYYAISSGEGLLFGLGNVILFFIGRFPVGRFVCVLTGKAENATNPDLVREYFGARPEIHSTLKRLVVDMDKLWQSENERWTAFRKGKIDASAFLESIGDGPRPLEILSPSIVKLTHLYLSSLDRNSYDKNDIDSTALTIIKLIYSDIERFQDCYPNWPTSYAYAEIYFKDSPDIVLNVIKLAIQY